MKRIAATQEFLSSRSLAKISAMVTTEFALADASAALWPEYIGFDGQLRETVGAQQLPVFAHAADVNLGQCLYGDTDSTAGLRRHWLERWDHPVNAALVQRVRAFAKANGLTTREVNVAWLVNHTFPCIAIVPLPSPLTERTPEFERASQFLMNEADRTWLKRSLDKA